jgi:hypothetical protein
MSPELVRMMFEAPAPLVIAPELCKVPPVVVTDSVPPETAFEATRLMLRLLVKLMFPAVAFTRLTALAAFVGPERLIPPFESTLRAFAPRAPTVRIPAPPTEPVVRVFKERSPAVVKALLTTIPPVEFWIVVGPELVRSVDALTVIVPVPSLRPIVRSPVIVDSSAPESSNVAATRSVPRPFRAIASLIV